MIGGYRVFGCPVWGVYGLGLVWFFKVARSRWIFRVVSLFLPHSMVARVAVVNANENQ